MRMTTTIFRSQKDPNRRGILSFSRNEEVTFVLLKCFLVPEEDRRNSI